MTDESVKNPSGSAVLSPSVDAIESPCVNVCELDTDFVCKGCRRSIEEILKWQEYTIEQQTAVLDRIFGEKKY